MLLFHAWAQDPGAGAWKTFVWGPPMVAFAFVLAIIVLIGMMARQSTEDVREWWRDGVDDIARRRRIVFTTSSSFTRPRRSGPACPSRSSTRQKITGATLRELCGNHRQPSAKRPSCGSQPSGAKARLQKQLLSMYVDDCRWCTPPSMTQNPVGVTPVRVRFPPPAPTNLFYPLAFTLAGSGGRVEKGRSPFPLSAHRTDVTISVIRLSDGFHPKACAARNPGHKPGARTPSFPNTSVRGDCR
jgi:hypothetical protein